MRRDIVYQILSVSHGHLTDKSSTLTDKMYGGTNLFDGLQFEKSICLFSKFKV